jgi:hypothetical protein
MLWMDARAVYDEAFAAFEKQYWRDLIAETGGDMRTMMRLSGQRRTAIHKILHRNDLHRPIPVKHQRTVRTGNWAQHGL